MSVGKKVVTRVFVLYGWDSFYCKKRDELIYERCKKYWGNLLQDVLIRFKRMQGYGTLWLPGEDHASIATEVRVEQELIKQEISRTS